MTSWTEGRVSNPGPLAGVGLVSSCGSWDIFPCLVTDGELMMTSQLGWNVQKTSLRRSCLSLIMNLTLGV